MTKKLAKSISLLWLIIALFPYVALATEGQTDAGTLSNSVLYNGGNGKNAQWLKSGTSGQINQLLLNAVADSGATFPLGVTVYIVCSTDLNHTVPCFPGTYPNTGVFDQHPGISEITSPYTAYITDGNPALLTFNLTDVITGLSPYLNGSYYYGFEWLTDGTVKGAKFYGDNTVLYSNYGTAPWGDVSNNTNAGAVVEPYFLIDSNPDVNSGITRFINVIPLVQSTVATTTSVGAEMYINPTDYQDGMTLDMTFSNLRVNTQVAALVPVTQNVSIPIHSSGHINAFATTTFAFGGAYGGTYSLNRHSLLSDTEFFFTSIFGYDLRAVISTSTAFYVGAPSTFDTTLASTTALVNDFLNTGTTTGLKYCSWGQFELITCTTALFLPDAQSMSTFMTSMTGIYKHLAPWGYATRFFEILNSTTTVGLPTFTTSIQTGDSTSTDSTSLTFDPGDMLAGGAATLESIKDPYHGKSARDIFEPIIRLVVALAVIIEIFYDVSKTSHHASTEKRKAANA